MPYLLWNVTRQSLENPALYSSEDEALSYAARIQSAQALQHEEADHVVAAELPGRVA